MRKNAFQFANKIKNIPKMRRNVMTFVLKIKFTTWKPNNVMTNAQKEKNTILMKAIVNLFAMNDGFTIRKLQDVRFHVQRATSSMLKPNSVILSAIKAIIMM